MLHIYVDWSWNMLWDKSWWIWIVVIKDWEIINSISEWYSNTTNQKMELLAIIRALQNTTWPVTIYSDSQYALSCSWNWFNSEKWNYKIWWVDLWWTTWKLWSDEMKEDWSPILCNRYYIREIHSLMDKRKINLIWIRWHTWIEWNEMADQLSNRRDNCTECEFDTLEIDYIYDKNNKNTL